MLKFEDDYIEVSTNISKTDTKARRNKNMSTNTGPDVILMLNDLKLTAKPAKLREAYNLNINKDSDDSDLAEGLSTFSPNTAYQSITKPKKKINRSVHSLSQVMETHSNNPYNTSSKLKKSNSSGRYSTVDKSQKSDKSVNKSVSKMDKYKAFRLYNLDRLERQITGRTDSVRQAFTSNLSKTDNSKDLMIIYS
jgi:hypothetical protein